MTSPLRTTKTGLEFIKRFEGFRARAFRLPDGRWTIGHGHVRSAREGVMISRDDAEALLIYDLRRVESDLESCLLSPLNSDQYDAIVSFAYNISPGQFRQSDVLRLINRGEHIEAAHAIEAWRKARINGKLMVVDALVRRRAAEKAMFLKHPSGPALCPTPLIAPELDAQWRTSSAGDAKSHTEPKSLATQDDDVRDVANAVEALAVQAQKNAAPVSHTAPVPEAAASHAANDDHEDDADNGDETEPKSARYETADPAAVEELKDRINRVLAREEAAAEAKETARRQSLADAFEPVHEDESTKTEETQAHPPADKSDASAFRTIKAASGGADAFGLSRAIGEDEDPSKVILSQPSKDSEAKTPKTDKDADAQRPAEAGFQHADVKEPDARKRGRAIWGVALIGSLGLIFWGGVDFFQKSRAVQDVTRQDVVFGPMLILLGAILCLIALYYVFARKDAPDLV